MILLNQRESNLRPSSDPGVRKFYWVTAELPRGRRHRAGAGPQRLKGRRHALCPVGLRSGLSRGATAGLVLVPAVLTVHVGVQDVHEHGVRRVQPLCLGGAGEHGSRRVEA